MSIHSLLILHLTLIVIHQDSPNCAVTICEHVRTTIKHREPGQWGVSLVFVDVQISELPQTSVLDRKHAEITVLTCSAHMSSAQFNISGPVRSTVKHREPCEVSLEFVDVQPYIMSLNQSATEETCKD